MECPRCRFNNPEDTRFCGQCGTKLPTPEKISSLTLETLSAPISELTTGSTFAGRYQVVEELGKGGMGRVYKVFDKEIKEKVALKLLKPEIAGDEETIERFRNELKFARKIAHKNVCRMFDLGRWENNYYIAMEYVSGENLKSIVRMLGELSAGKAIFIAKQVCEGLAEAHKLGIVHRDLKPQNIMIDQEGNVRIMDFGIARSIKAKGITGAGMMIGTPEYMSPEQVEGKEADPRSDIYSLGIILYEMLTGKVPFEGATALSIALKHKTEMPKSPQELNAHIPDDLSQLIMRCLEKDKEKRFQTAGDILAIFLKMERGLPTTEKVLPQRKTKAERMKGLRLTRIIKYGVAAILLAALILAAFFLLKGRGKAIDSIAVLPFHSTNLAPGSEYLSDGITESLISKLSELPSLRRVISSFSVARYKGQSIDPKKLGSEFGVRAILTGRIVGGQESLAVNVELVDSKDNSVVWSGQYKHKLADVFEIQQEISEDVSQKLRLRLTGEEKKRLAKRATQNPQAYEAYLNGRFYWNKRTRDGLTRGLEYFEKAIAADPLYALAYTGLSDSYLLLTRYSFVSPQDSMPKAKAAVLRALEIDPSLGEAHNSLAFVKMYNDFDFAEAEKEWRKAIEFNPNYATAHHWYGLLLMRTRRPTEALAELKRAYELDPLSIIINTNVAWNYYFARQYDQAIEQFKKTLEMDPNYAVAHQRLGQAYLQEGKFDAALEEFQKAVELSPESTEIQATLAHGYGVAGKRKEAKDLLQDLLRLSAQKYVSAYDLAMIHLGLGDTEQTFAFLEKAYEEKASYITFLGVDPRLDGLRTYPRFLTLMKKMKLE